MKSDQLLRWTGLVMLIAIGAFLLVRCDDKAVATGVSEREFLHPSVENRPLALWPWLNGFVDTAKLVYELREMKNKGMRGAVIWDIGALADPDDMIPEGPAFLGDQSLKYISLALKTAEELGLDLGLVASSSWNAGGPWVDSADASMQLLSTRRIVEGPATEKIAIGIPKSRRGEASRYARITSMAIPYSDSKVVDLNSQHFSLDEFTTQDQFIGWEGPQGNWEILSFFMANTGQNLVVPSPNSSGLVIDHLSQRATQSHFDSLLARLEKVSTPDHHLKFFMLDSYEVWQMKDWSPLLLDEFTARYEYDPKPFLPLLLGYSSKDSIMDKRFRRDYRRLVSDMMIENHFGQSVKIANEYGIKMLTEAGHGGNARVEPLKALGHSHIPMGEFWNRQRHWVTKEAASAAHIYGKKVVASESLTGWQHWQQGPTDFKQLCDMAFCEGLNQIVFHTFAHNPEMAGQPGFVYHAGEHINVNATWWDMARPFMDYLSRCSYMLRQGHFVADVLLYYGDDAPNLVPPKRIDPNYSPDMPGIFPPYFYDDSKCPHCGRPKPIDPGNLPGYDYDYINADVITTTLSTEDGRWKLPHGQSYKVMLLPDREDLSLAVLKSIEKLVYNGAVVVGRKPERTTSLKNYPDCDEELKAIADKMWGACDGEKVFSNDYGEGKVYWGKSAEEVLAELNIPPDLGVTGIDNRDRHIDYIHRRSPTEEIYFISNSSHSQEKVTCTFRVNPDMIPELWDAETGFIQRTVAHSEVEDGIRVELVLDPISSRFVVFKKRAGGNDDAGLAKDLQFGHLKNHMISTKIDLTNDWQVSFDTVMGAPATYAMKELTSWSDIDREGIKYYSGTASYSREFIVEESSLSKATDVYVQFEDVQEIARVFVNGKDCGVIWTPPYSRNISRYLKPGSNDITVQIANTWNNRIVGDLRTPEKGVYTQTNAKSKFKTESPLLKSGLMGKAEIVIISSERK